MTKKPKRKKLPTIPALKRKADKLWSVLILIDGQEKLPWQGGPTATCQVCREREAYGAHHIFHKSMHGRVRYDRRNGLPVCRYCHFMERRDPAPTVFAALRYHGYLDFTQFGVQVMDSRNQGAYKWNREKINMVISELNDMISDTVFEKVVVVSEEALSGKDPGPAPAGL